MRSTAGLVWRRCLRSSAAPVAVALAMACVGAWRTAQHPEDAAGAQSPWLHLPAFVAAAACCLAALVAWPTFARGRPGADLVRRALGPGLAGCGAATAGALGALACWLAAVALLGAAVAPLPHAHRALVPRDRPLLDAAHERVAFAGGGVTADAVLLRPVAMLSLGTIEPVTVRVLVDGRVVTPEPLAVAGTRQLLRVPLHGPVGELAVERTGGTLTLVFPPDSVELVLAGERSRVANALLALLLYVLPAAVALALAALLAPFVALPVAATVVLAALVLQTLGRLGPTGDAVIALLRGRWLPAEPGPWRQAAAAAAVAAGALLLAWWTRRRA